MLVITALGAMLVKYRTVHVHLPRLGCLTLIVLCAETNRFCQEWATTMQGEEEESKPSYLRQVVENFKLKIIQDLNNLRRLLQHAEKDHYALYR